MPFRSEAQRRFLYAKHPEIAKRWSKKYGSKPILQAAAITRLKRKRGTTNQRKN